MELVKKFSEDMETMLRRKVEAVQVTDCRWSSPGWAGFTLYYTNKVTTDIRGGMLYKERDTSCSQLGFVDIQGLGYLSTLEQPWRVDPHG